LEAKEVPADASDVSRGLYSLVCGTKRGFAGR
jgi:hypothetical protein